MNKLRELRKQRRLTQTEMAGNMGIAQNTYSYWESGKVKIDNVSLLKLANFFNTTVDDILGKESIRPKGIKIPVLGRVQAGIPVEAVEDIIDYEEITQELAAQGEYFALQIRGDSMEPKISAGDVVIVRKQSDIESGQVGVIIVNGSDATIKRIVKHTEGITLIANNPIYPPKFYTNNEIVSTPIEIIGKVVELRAKI